MTLPLHSSFILNSITAVVFLFFVVAGYARGLIHQLLDLVGFIAAFVLAWFFAPQIASAVPLIPSNLSWYQTPLIGESLYHLSNRVVWFVLVVIGVSLVMTLIVKPFAKGIHKIPVAKTLNRILGAVYGLIPATLLAILMCLLLTTPIFSNGRSSVEAAGLLKPFLFVSDAILDSFYQTSDESGLIQKLMSGQSLSTDDFSQIPSWLTQLGLPEDLKAPMEKLIRQETLSDQEISTIKAYIDSEGWTPTDVENLLSHFNVGPEQIDVVLDKLGMK